MKNWYQSKTVWFNIITILIAALTQFSGVVESADLKNAILAAVGLLNIALRVFSTATPIETPSEVKKFVKEEREVVERVGNLIAGAKGHSPNGTRSPGDRNPGGRTPNGD